MPSPLFTRTSFLALAHTGENSVVDSSGSPVVDGSGNPIVVTAGEPLLVHDQRPYRALGTLYSRNPKRWNPREVIAFDNGYGTAQCGASQFTFSPCQTTQFHSTRQPRSLMTV